MDLLWVPRELQNESDSEQFLVKSYADLTIHKALCLGGASQQLREVRREEMHSIFTLEMSTTELREGD